MNVHPSSSDQGRRSPAVPPSHTAVTRVTGASTPAVFLEASWTRNRRALSWGTRDSIPTAACLSKTTTSNPSSRITSALTSPGDAGAEDGNAVARITDHEDMDP